MKSIAEVKQEYVDKIAKVKFNKEKAIKAIHAYYSRLQIKNKTPIVITLPSPHACLQAATLMRSAWPDKTQSCLEVLDDIYSTVETLDDFDFTKDGIVDLYKDQEKATKFMIYVTALHYPELIPSVSPSEKDKRLVEVWESIIMAGIWTFITCEDFAFVSAPPVFTEADLWVFADGYTEPQQELK